MPVLISGLRQKTVQILVLFCADRHSHFKSPFFFFENQINRTSKKETSNTRHRFGLQQTPKENYLQALPPSLSDGIHSFSTIDKCFTYVIYDMSNMTAVSWIALTTESESLSII